MWTPYFVGLALIGCINSFPKASTEKRYDGHQVLQVLPSKVDEIRTLLKLAKKYKVDVWNAPKTLNDTFDVLVSPENLKAFAKDIKTIGLSATTWIKDLQKLIDEEKKYITVPHRVRRASQFNLAAYHHHSSINGYLDALASTNPLVSVYSMGRSTEGRDMKYIKISSGSNANKKAIYVDGGIHAREWLSISTVLYMIKQVSSSSDATVNNSLSKFDFYFAPVVNPDGYEYSISHDRMWRKNRKTHSYSRCFGVDLNRNFNYHWNPSNGGSYDPCEEIYAGQHAASEIETQNIQNMMTRHPNIIAYLNVHTYGQLWLYPWGYTSHLPSDYRDLDHLGQIAATAVRQIHGTRFTVGEDTRVLYSAAGGADDYAKGACGIKYAYTVELRDEGRHGFVAPTSYITPTGEEMWAGLKAFASELIRYESL